MVDGFVRKKVESLTLGEKLKKLRSQYRMSLTEISKATKIQVKYLEYLENGEYEKLPAEVYTKGFLKSYARYLSMDEGAFLKLYDKEKNIQAQLGKEVLHEVRPRVPLTSSFVISSRLVILSGIALLVLGTFLYLFLEFRSFVSEPSLLILDPLNGAKIESSKVTLKGKTDRGAEVNINGQGVFVGSDGSFSEALSLQLGRNTIIVRAVNRFEKEKETILTVEAVFETLPPGQAETARDRFTLKVTGREKGARVVLEADGVIVYSGLLARGEEQTVTATTATIATDNGAATWVSFKGGESKPLSEKAALLPKITFTTEGRQDTIEH